MNTAAMVTMVLVGGFIWGGFGLLLYHGVRSERRKTRILETGRKPRDNREVRS